VAGGPAGTLCEVPISSRLLDDGEEVVVDLRPHWVFLLGPAVLTVVALAVAIAVVVRFPKAPVTVAGVLAVMVAIPVIWLAGRIVRWLGISLVVTTNRLIYRRGVFGRDLVQLRLLRIAEVHCTQTFVERLIGSGRLVVELVGDDPMAIEDVRRPRTLQRVIARELDEASRDRAQEAGWSGFGGPSPAAGVPAQPISVPRPFALDDTPPHGMPLPAAAPTLPIAPAVGVALPAAPGGAYSVPDQLIALDDLRRRGIISDGEFEAKKTELLSRL
jgi:membrane protein YdbS with pleckstrin-like domain